MCQWGLALAPTPGPLLVAHQGLGRTGRVRRHLLLAAGEAWVDQWAPWAPPHTAPPRCCPPAPLQLQPLPLPVGSMTLPCPLAPMPTLGPYARRPPSHPGPQGHWDHLKLPDLQLVCPRVRVLPVRR